MSQDELYDEYQRRYGHRRRSDSMPRSLETPEWKILRWFKSVPLGEAQLLLSVVRDTLKEREGEEGSEIDSASGLDRIIGKAVQGDPSGRRRKRKKSNGAPQAEVETFN
jgi:hypothetical protein